MRILNIEDNLDKHMNICMQLKQFNSEVIWKENLDDGIKALDEGRYDLIITDMSYPIHKGEKANDDAGNMLISYANEKELEAPVILCTSFAMKKTDIFGTVNYSPETNWGSELQALIRQYLMQARSK